MLFSTFLGENPTAQGCSHGPCVCACTGIRPELVHNGCQLCVPPCHPSTPVFMDLYIFILACSACTLPARERTGSLQHLHTALLSAEVRGRTGRRKAQGTKALPSQVFFSNDSPRKTPVLHKQSTKKPNKTQPKVLLLSLRYLLVIACVAAHYPVLATQIIITQSQPQSTQGERLSPFPPRSVA